VVTTGGHGVGTLLGDGVIEDGGMRPDAAGCNTNSPSPSSPATVTMVGCSLMLLTHDPSTAATHLAAGVLSCPVQGCAGRLGPWGHARQRVLRPPLKAQSFSAKGWRSSDIS